MCEKKKTIKRSHNANTSIRSTQKKIVRRRYEYDELNRGGVGVDIVELPGIRIDDALQRRGIEHVLVAGRLLARLAEQRRVVSHLRW